MDYLKIKNWDKYQHYKKRNPPWIKFYGALLDDYKYSCLHDDSKLLLVSLFLLASKCQNNIPLDLPWIKNKCGLNFDINLKPLIDSGFITQNGDDSTALSK